MRRLLFALLTVSGVACGSFGADSPGSPGANADAGTDSTMDAGVEASTGLDACAGLTCLDFTDPATFHPGWEEKVAGSSPAPKVENGWMVSELGSNRDGDLVSRLSHPVPLTARHTLLTFDFRLDAPASVDDLQKQFTIAELLCASDDGSYQQGVLVNVLGANLHIGVIRLYSAPFLLDQGYGNLKKDDPIKVELDVDWRADPSFASLKINGQKVNDAVVPGCAGHANFTVRVGLGSATQQPAKAYYDNVVFSADP